MGSSSKTAFDLQGARSLLAVALSALIKTSGDASKALPRVVASIKIDDDQHAVVIANDRDVVIVWQPYSKLASLLAAIGDDLFIQKVLGDRAVDAHLGQAIIRARYASQSKKDHGRLHVVEMRASRRAAASLRMLRTKARLPAGFVVTVAEPVLAAA